MCPDDHTFLISNILTSNIISNMLTLELSNILTCIILKRRTWYLIIEN